MTGTRGVRNVKEGGPGGESPRHEGGPGEASPRPGVARLGLPERGKKNCESGCHVVDDGFSGYVAAILICDDDRSIFAVPSTPPRACAAVLLLPSPPARACVGGGARAGGGRLALLSRVCGTMRRYSGTYYRRYGDAENFTRLSYCSTRYP
jgi:hypothetical protein